MKRILLAAALPGITAAFLATIPPSVHADVDGTWSLGPGPDTTATAPSPRREYAAVYDVQRDRYIIFGGWAFQSPHPSGLFRQTWELTLGDTPAWAPLFTVGSGPGERHSPQWGYDPARERMIIMGGYGHHYPNGPDAYLNDVWQLSLDGTPAWTELVPVTSLYPSGRLAGASIYDPLRQRFVLFGGTVGATLDTYVLDLSVDPPVWSIVPKIGTHLPYAGYGMTAIYDPVRDRLVMFGGSTTDDYFGVHDQVWELTLSGTPTWNEITPAVPGPIARRTLTSIYDPVRDRMVIFAGWDNFSNQTSSFLNDTWALSLSGDPAWTELEPAGPLPTGRDAMCGVYDANSDRFVVFGGWSGAQLLGDTWFLDWDEAPKGAVIVPSAEAVPGVAHLRWGVTDAMGTNAAVFRRAPGGDWSSVAMVQRNGAGEVVYDDATVTPGATYDYQVAVPSQRGPEFGGQISVQVPTAVPVEPGSVSFALRAVQPNPVVDRLNVSFVLASEARAELALYNVAGRKLITRDVGGLGSGPHSVDLGHARDLAPGLYFLKLEQAGQVQTRRVIVAGS